MSAEFVVETSQDIEPILPVVPLMQQVYQQGMSDLETALFYARVGRISFDSTSDPLDFLQSIETRTQTAHRVSADHDC